MKRSAHVDGSGTIRTDAQRRLGWDLFVENFGISARSRHEDSLPPPVILSSITDVRFSFLLLLPIADPLRNTLQNRTASHVNWNASLGHG